MIHLFCVAPEFQGQGLARKTMGLVMDESRNAGKKSVRLDAITCNEPAKRLYESLGFQKRDQRNWYTANLGYIDFYLYEFAL